MIKNRSRFYRLLTPPYCTRVETYSRAT